MDMKKIIDKVGRSPLSGATCPGTIGFVEISKTQNYGFGSSPANRKNVGWKIAEHIIMESQPADVLCFIRDVWKKCTDADPRKPCTQILYVPTSSPRGPNMYTAFNASGDEVKKGPLSTIFPWAELGFPKVGEFVRTGFRRLEEFGGLDANDLLYLTSDKSAEDFKTAGYKVLKISDGSPNECYDEDHHLRYYPNFIFKFFGQNYRLTKELKIHSYLSFFDYFVTKGVDVSMIKKNNYVGELGAIQKIVYGAPGTGKSYGTGGKLKDEHGNALAVSFRTTFHPDSDYSTFVGSYKPMVKKGPRIVQNGTVLEKPTYGADVEDALKVEERICYEFRPQAFMNAYVTAWKDLTKPVVLIIEEINRGNCAQIFGDLFQLLDRDDATGYSTYPITADTDLAVWLAEAERFGAAGLADPGKPECLQSDDWTNVLKGKMLALPPNLYIWATMNTSDQSLFPIDSAFKRRWDWKYVPIRNHEEEAYVLKIGDSEYRWWSFLTAINKRIWDATDSEDKKLGYFFVKARKEGEKNVIDADKFLNKVVFYLWNDVFKNSDPDKAFKFVKPDGKNVLVTFHDFFKEVDGTRDDLMLNAFIRGLGVKTAQEEDDEKKKAADTAHPAPVHEGVAEGAADHAE